MPKLSMTKLPAPDDRASRLVISVAASLLVFALVVLVALLAADVDDDSSRHCPGYAVGTVDPVTCLPYGSAGAAPAGTNHSGSNSGTVRKPAQPKAPAAKVPAAPKAPAAPPRVSLGKR